jgi:hypothetical protein
VFLGDESLKALKQIVLPKNRVEKFLQKNQQQKTDFFSRFFLVFGCFSVREVQKHNKKISKTNLTSPGTFLAPEEPTNHVKARHSFFLVPLGNGPPNRAGRWPLGVGVTIPTRPPRDPTNTATNRQPAIYPIPAGSIDLELNASTGHVADIAHDEVIPAERGKQHQMAVFIEADGIAGYLRTLVLDNRTAYHGYFVFLRLETGFGLSSSWLIRGCYGSSTNRSGLFFMNISKLASGNRISTVFNGQKHFFKIAGSKVLDEYYNSYLKR